MHNATRHRMLAQIWSADEFVPPTGGCRIAGGIALGLRIVPSAAMIGADLKGAAHPGIDGMIGRFESKDHDRIQSVARFGKCSFVGFDQTTVRRIKTGLGDRAHHVGAFVEIGDPHRRRRSEAWLLA
jgi:hypothetical protein